MYIYVVYYYLTKPTEVVMTLLRYRHNAPIFQTRVPQFPFKKETCLCDNVSRRKRRVP